MVSEPDGQVVLTISLPEIREIFNKLLAGEMTREEADTWAGIRVCAGDAGSLRFTCPADEERIWDALSYLHGCDLKASPTEYLHSPKELNAWYSELFSNSSSEE